MNLLSLLLQVPEMMAGENPATEMLEKEEKYIEGFKGLSIQDSIDKLASSMVDFAFKLVIAIIVFYLGRFIIRKLYNLALKIMVTRGTDASLCTFLLSLLRITLYFILIVTVIGILGLETSSFLALFASAGVAIGMALSGTLQNFAGGVLILLLKPYRVGDFIEAQGYTGTVKAIQIFNTVINTLDNKAIIIPNGGLSTSSINNYSMEDYRRVDWTISLSYDTDLDAAKEAILSMLNEDTRVVTQYVEDDRLTRLKQQQVTKTEIQKEEGNLIAKKQQKTQRPWWRRFLGHRKQIVEQVKEGGALPAVIPTVKKDCSPFVGLAEMADSSINIAVRAWTPASEYWGLFYEMNERFYKELPKKRFSFPFPQLDVHVNPLS